MTILKIKKWHCSSLVLYVLYDTLLLLPFSASLGLKPANQIQFQTPSTNLQEKRILNKYLNIKALLAAIKTFILLVILHLKFQEGITWQFKVRNIFPKQNIVTVHEGDYDRFHHRMNITEYKALLWTAGSNYIKLQKYKNLFPHHSIVPHAIKIQQACNSFFFFFFPSSVKLWGNFPEEWIWNPITKTSNFKSSIKGRWPRVPSPKLLVTRNCVSSNECNQ